MRNLLGAFVQRLRPLLADGRGADPTDEWVGAAARRLVAGEGAALSAERRLRHRLVVKAGLAFQEPWWSERSGQALAPANSGPGDAAAPFIMLANRQFYLTARPLRPGEWDAQDVPSCLKGQTAVMAGLMTIADGTIEVIRLDCEGQGGADNLRAVLMALKTAGVDLRSVRLVDNRNPSIGGMAVNAERYLRGALTWGQFVGGTVGDLAKRGAAAPAR